MTGDAGELPRTAWAEIDLGALAGNLRAVRALAGDGVEVSAVVKANGYGHGLVDAGRAFLSAGANGLAVATLDEGLALRAAGVRAPVLVLFAVPRQGLGAALAAGLDLVVADLELGRELLDAMASRESAGRDGGGALPTAIHLEVETGLGRAGVRPSDAATLAARIAATRGLRLAALWSHLARPDDAAASSAQAARLREAVDRVRAAGVEVPGTHLAGTGGLFAGTGAMGTMVRPGLCLYGELPDDLPLTGAGRAAAHRLRPALRLVARPLRILEVEPGEPIGYGGRWVAERPSRVATLPIGYGDGYARPSQPGAEALVRGRRVPLAGTIAMDALAVDVTDVPGVGMDDEFVLLGAQGDERITANELARRRTTISWEVLATLAARLPRVYHAGPGTTGVGTPAHEVRSEGGREARV